MMKLLINGELDEAKRETFILMSPHIIVHI